jgi:VanZ family protein
MRGGVLIRAQMKLFLRYWLPVILWMALIFSASGDTKSVERTDGILSRLFRALHIQVTPAQRETLRWIARKGAHVTEYAVFALLWWRALRGREQATGWSTKTAAIVLLVCVLYAASDEFHQYFVGGRSASVADVGIDTLGALTALAIVRVVTLRWRRQPA